MIKAIHNNASPGFYEDPILFLTKGVFQFEEPGPFSMLEKWLGYNFLRTSFLWAIKRFAKEKKKILCKKKHLKKSNTQKNTT